MNKDLLEKHILKFVSDLKKNKEKFTEHFREREELVNFYQSFHEDKIIFLRY